MENRPQNTPRSGGQRRPETVHFTCHGHGNVRATHGKTLELTRDPEISPRATCIVGVSADYDPVRVARLRGPVEMRLSMGDAVETVRAEVSPFLDASRALVLRRSEQRHGKTFAYRAYRAAADLDRGFVAALGDPRARLAVELEELPSPDLGQAGALFFGAPPTPASPWPLGRLAVDAFAGRRETLETLLPKDDRVDKISLDGSAEAREAVLERLEAGGRVALLFDPTSALDPELYALTARAAAQHPISPLPAFPGRLAVLAISGFPLSPRILAAGDPERPVRRPKDLREVLEPFADSPATLILENLELPPRDALGIVEAVLGDRDLALGVDLGGSREELHRGLPSDIERALAGGPESRRQRHRLILAAAPPSDDGGPLRRLEPALHSLLADGVPVRTLVRALQRLAGIRRSGLYDRLLGLRDRGEEP